MHNIEHYRDRLLAGLTKATISRSPRWRIGILVGIIMLEALIATIDGAVPQDVPISHLFYVPIILASVSFGYLGGTIIAGLSLVLFALANYTWEVPPAPERFLPAATLTLAYYVAVALAAAAFAGRQRKVGEIGARLQARVGQLDALNRVALTIAASDALEPILRTILVGAQELSAAPLVGILPLAPRDSQRATFPGIIERDETMPGVAPPSASFLRRATAAKRAIVLGADTGTGLTLDGPWRSLLLLPLIVGGECVGVLYAIDTRARTFESARQPLETLASQAAEAVARARLRSRELDLAVSDERNRLAREIHDTLAQSLLAIVLRLERVLGLLPDDPGQAHAEAHRAATVARDALGEARRSVRGLRPAPLERGPLPEALEAEVAVLRDDAGITSELAVEGDVAPLDAAVADALFGVAREALANVRKHARARRVNVTLARAADEMRLSVRDDGVGFDPSLPAAQADDHYGLRGMRERIELLGGHFAVTSERGQGVLLQVAVPTQPPRTGTADHPIRVLLCDDHALVRRGVAEALMIDPRLAVIGEAGTGAEALARAALTQPDVVLLDLRLPDIDGVEVTRRLREARPHLPIVLLTTFGDDPAVLDALRAGAAGCLLKDHPTSAIVDAIHAAVNGESFLTPGVADRVLSAWRAGDDKPMPDELSPREREVLQLIAQGARNKEIAHSLGITERTAKAHVSRIIAKLDAVDRTAAVTAAIRRGLLRV